MTDDTQTDVTLSDEDMRTILPGGSTVQTVRASIRDTDGTDGDDTDAQDADGTDATDAKDADGTDGDASDAG
jgi:hypothetical protein